MGRLSITVHKCNVYHSYSLAEVNPVVKVVVDGSYIFKTTAKEGTFSPSYDETFVVDNTHRLAVIEVSVVHKTDIKKPNEHHLYHQLTGQNVLSVFTRNSDDKLLNDKVEPKRAFASEGETETVIGTCMVSTKRLERGKTKLRQYVLVTPGSSAAGGGGCTTAADADSISVAGEITLSIRSDSLGDADVTLNETLEREYAKRLQYLFLKYDRRKLAQIDLILADVRDPAEVNPAAVSSTGGPSLSFDSLLKSLETEYGPEPEVYTLEATVLGCTDLMKSSKQSSSINAYVILRTDCEEFVTSSAGRSSNPVWNDDNKVTFCVVNPEAFFVDITVRDHNVFSKDEEIGRARIAVGTLACEHSSERCILVCSSVNNISPTVSGMVHLRLTPHKFGATPLQNIEYIDDFYERMNRFFVSYCESRVPQIDMYVHARKNELEEYMMELVRDYGYEPGTTRLWFTFHQIRCLMENMHDDVRKVQVAVVLTMGGSKVVTKARDVVEHCPIDIDETYVMDVVRETDVIRVEVVKANDPSVCYGRVDFTCMNVQRGVENRRNYYLVGNAGQDTAYPSGCVTITLMSHDYGLDYPVDMMSERMYYGRLRRFIFNREPSKLHRADVALATIFDMETYMAHLAADYGPERPTLALYLTVVGCRQLKSKLGGISPYVVARVGVNSYETRFVKNCTEPDYFEFFEFYIGGTEGNYLHLYLMDHKEIGDDEELARMTLSLDEVQVGTQYSDWTPLLCTERGNTTGKTFGAIGIKFILKDLKLIDELRVELVGMGKERHTQEFSPLAAHSPEDATVARRRGIRSRMAGMTKKIFGQAQALLQYSEQGGHTRTNSFSISENVPAEEGVPDASMDGQHLRDRNSSRTRKDESRPLDLLDEDNSFGDAYRPLDQSMSTSLAASDQPPWLQSSRFTSSSPLSGTGSENVNCTPESCGFSDEVTELLDPAKKYLRVLVYRCTDLAPERTHRYLPNPYLSLSTAMATYRTRTRTRSVNPKYHEEFVFEIDNPEQDILTITALANSAFGLKGLGQCVLSLKNVQRDVPRRRVISFVVHPLKKEAYQRGTINLAIMAIGFGMDVLPNPEAENRFRLRVQEMLTFHAPQELHKLEWMVGEYCTREQDLLSMLVNKYGTVVSDDVAASVRITIRSVKGLTDRNGNLVDKVPCYIKLHAASAVVRTKNQEILSGVARIGEVINMRIREPQKLLIRVSVYPDEMFAKKFGEFYMSLADIHRGVAKERVFAFVNNSGSVNAQPCGLLAVELYSDTFGGAQPMSAEEEMENYTRLRDFYMAYMPQDLHMVDPRCSTTANMEVYLKSLVASYGPEPGNHHLAIKFMGLRLISHTQGVGKEMEAVAYFRCNAQHIRKKFTVSKEGYVQASEQVSLTILVPEQDEINLVVYAGSRSKKTEIGRTIVPLNTMIKGQPVRQSLPLVIGMHTKRSQVEGLAELTLETESFGLDPHSSEANFMTHTYSEFIDPDSLTGDRDEGRGDISVSSKLSSVSRSFFAHEHGRSADSEAQGPTDESHLTVALLGFRNFTHENVYVKAYKNHEVLFRTKGGHSSTMENAGYQGTTAVFPGEDGVVTFKISQDGIFSGAIIAYIDYGIRNLPRNRATDTWLPFFDKKGTVLGELGVRFTTENYGTAFDHESAVLQYKARLDVISLLAKYSPKDLRRINVSLAHTRAIRRIHAKLRTQFAPKAVGTVYCIVEELNIERAADDRVDVEVSTADDSDRQSAKIVCLGSLTSPGLEKAGAAGGEFLRVLQDSPFQLLRLDLPHDGVRGGLTFRVFLVNGAKDREVGRTTLSLRAVLTKEMYDSSKGLLLDLVLVKTAHNYVRSKLAGTVKLRFFSPFYEQIPDSFVFDKTVKASYQRDYVQHYYERITKMLEHYDPNTLTDFHHVLFDRDVASGRWSETLPTWLRTLVEKWGPEETEFPPPPPLFSDTDWKRGGTLRAIGRSNTSRTPIHSRFSSNVVHTVMFDTRAPLTDLGEPGTPARHKYNRGAPFSEALKIDLPTQEGGVRRRKVVVESTP